MSEVSLRACDHDDVQVLYDWRNHPTTRAMSGTTAPLEFAAHQAWYQRMLAEKSAVMWMGCVGHIAIGSVRLDSTHSQPGVYTVSIQVDPAQRGKGYGQKLLDAACARARFEIHARQMIALIRPANLASRRIFNHAGFARHSELTPAGLEIWQKNWL